MKRRGTMMWHAVVLLSTFILSITIPLYLVLPSLIDSFFRVGVLLISIIYCIDLIIEVKHNRNLGREKYRDYLRSWFIIDLVSIVPFVLLPLWPMLSFLQLLKLSHVGSRVNENIRQSPRYGSLLRLVHLGSIIIIVLQGAACLRSAVHPIKGMDDASSYIHSLFWATETLANAGQSEAPTENRDIILQISVMLVGLVMYGYLIGNIASILNKIDPARVHHEEVLEKVHAFIRYRSIPLHLERRINEFYSYVWEQRLGYDETSVLAGLPPGLKTEVSLYLKREVLERVNIFRGASEEFIREIAVYLRAQIVMPGDYVFKVGDSAISMYFISKGSVEVLSSDGTVLKTLKEGDFFGEMALIRKRKRNASVRALEHTDLYVLEVESFERILSEHPDFKTNIEDVVKERTAF